ncbi:MAG: triose-phosphate isomerase [Phycisphaerales bacterium]|nr:MAG: triose-phosphate isomerase [Phycisphaerales bacterium]
MPQRMPYVGGNWKMNTDLAGATALAEAVAAGAANLLSACQVVVCPPLTYLQAVGKALEGSAILLGAQNFHHQPSGAFTGEVSCSMLKDLGVGVVLCGHSERRHVMGEGDVLINAKVLAALEAGLQIILCIGEKIEQREAGQTDAVNAGQLAYGLAGVKPEQLARVTIAYEPVWAIGTGKTATPIDAQNAHRAIRNEIRHSFGDAAADAIRIQYGGSVKPGNAGELFSQPDIDGGLIGGASLKAGDFLAIVRAAAETGNA